MMLTFSKLIKELKSGNIYMLIGNGSKNQFRYLSNLKHIVKKLKTENQQKISVYIHKYEHTYLSTITYK